MSGVKRALYICYWALGDPLTISSVMPSLPALKKHLGLDRLTLVTVERRGSRFPKFEIPYDFVDHIAIEPWAQALPLAAKVFELLLMPRLIERICRGQSVGLMVARCSLAGTIAYKIHRRTGVPFVVESFEPHSDYMANCGAWTKGGWKYRYARKYERLQMQHAWKLITVTENYRRHLVATEGVDEQRVAVIPCVTDLVRTRFDPELREKVRVRLGLGSHTTAIYLGKFGDLYYDDEAFRILQDAFQFFEGLRVILLTPSNEAHIRRQMGRHQIPADRVLILSVARGEVPGYLSAADFAYSFVRPHAASPFQCPIKHGEYWACGLPFIAPDRIGDDYSVIATEGGGANLDHDLGNVRECHATIGRMLAVPDYRASIRKLAVRHKDAGVVDREFARIFEGTHDTSGT